MEAVQLISNSSTHNHLDCIIKHFAKADEVWLATAFLKHSGLELLLPCIKKHLSFQRQIHIITGQNFGLTDPKALKVLHHLFLNKTNASLFLDKAERTDRVFHPKLFIFKNGENITIITGSANVTNGGLCNNEELSICIETTTTNPNWETVRNYFDEITSYEKADIVGLMVINRYEQFYLEQKRISEKQKVSPEKKSSEYSFDYSKLNERLKEYRIADYTVKLNNRIRDYDIAKKLLDEIVNADKLTQKRFQEIIDALVGKKGTKGLWKSGSLLRLRDNVYKHKNEFRLLVKSIKDNQGKAPSKVFNEGKRLVANIAGARMNYVAEIMMTYQPDRFANLNSNPIKTLKEEAGVYIKSHSSSFNGDDYQEYCSIIIEICNELKLRNMLEADSFFNDIYWKLKQEGKLK